jgi:multicomponent Na+:H+ antiporter subunit E
MVMSAVQVARSTVQPTLQIRPAIIEYPLDVESAREITVLANMISLTPGTLSMDVSPDRKVLYVHAITVSTDDGSEVIAEIKGSLEKHVKRALGSRS